MIVIRRNASTNSVSFDGHEIDLSIASKKKKRSVKNRVMEYAQKKYGEENEKIS